MDRHGVVEGMIPEMYVQDSHTHNHLTEYCQGLPLL